MPRISNKMAREGKDGASTFTYGERTYEMGLESIVIYDDHDHAEWLAQQLRTHAKHAPSKFPSPHWHTFSVVRLPA